MNGRQQAALVIPLNRFPFIVLEAVYFWHRGTGKRHSHNALPETSIRTESLDFLSAAAVTLGSDLGLCGRAGSAPPQICDNLGLTYLSASRFPGESILFWVLNMRSCKFARVCSCF